MRAVTLGGLGAARSRRRGFFGLGNKGEGFEFTKPAYEELMADVPMARQDMLDPAQSPYTMQTTSYDASMAAYSGMAADPEGEATRKIWMVGIGTFVVGGLVGYFLGRK